MSHADAHQPVQPLPESDAGLSKPADISASVYGEITDSMMRLSLTSTRLSSAAVPLLSDMEWRVKPPFRL